MCHRGVLHPTSQSFTFLGYKALFHTWSTMIISTILLAAQENSHSPIRENILPSALDFTAQPSWTGACWSKEGVPEQNRVYINRKSGEMSFKNTVRTISPLILTGFGSTMHGGLKVPPRRHALFTETNELRGDFSQSVLINTTFRKRLYSAVISYIRIWKNSGQTKVEKNRTSQWI